MVDPISMAVGGFLLAVGYGLRAMIGRRSGQRAEQPSPVCGCTHSLAVHNRETSNCHADVRRKRWTKTGYDAGYDWVRCACRQYVGPQPITEFWTPPMLPVDEVNHG